jgi:hypothetical protein
VLRPLDERDATLLSVINDSRADGVAPNRQAISVNMPNWEIATMLRDEDERWRG